MSGFACPRCLGAGVLITFDGKGGYACPSCAPPHMRRSAVALDCVNTIRKLEAIDREIALEEGRASRDRT